MKCIAVIPARYASTRLPGKALLPLGDKPIIQHVYERVSQVAGISQVLVATDDERIYNRVTSFGGQACMTSSEHLSGSDRIAEAVAKLECEWVFNIQGDEPTIRPEQIESVVSLFSSNETRIATLIKVIDKTEDLFNPNVVKVVTDKTGRALLFSRSPIPHIRQHPDDEWTSVFTFYRHIGIYAYLTQTLQDISGLQPAPPETAESLEQLRWLWNGYSIQTNITDFETIGIDTPEDLSKLTNIA